MRKLLFALALASLIPQGAFAQEDEDTAVDDAMDEAVSADGEEVEPEEDFSDLDMDGVDENPNAPRTAFNREKEPTKKVAVAKDVGPYPTESIYRPLTLPAGISQISFAIPINVDPFGVAANLSGQYGITDEIQVGLRYSLGRYSEEFSVGKAVALDLEYKFTDDIAGQVSMPFYLDPFAMGLTVGVPMRFEFFDSFALVAGRDFFSFRLVDFFPSIDNATQNDAFIDAVSTNTVTPKWIGNLSAGAIYQWDSQMAIDLQIGTRFDDARERAATAYMNAGVLYAKDEKLDFGARLGAASLADFTETLELRLFANWRI